jgi:hypothetical protein
MRRDGWAIRHRRGLPWRSEWLWAVTQPLQRIGNALVDTNDTKSIAGDIMAIPRGRMVAAPSQSGPS